MLVYISTEKNVLEIVITTSAAVAICVGLLYFANLSDIGQFFFNVGRDSKICCIRNERIFITIGLAAGIVMISAHLSFDSSLGWLVWSATATLAVLYGYTWIWLNVGLRDRNGYADYFSIHDAQPLVSPSNSVIVFEKDGVAYAHPISQLMRTHLARYFSERSDDNVSISYCNLSNLGVGYIPQINGERVDLHIIAQHGNNLILRDKKTREPIQQIYGFRERDGKTGPAMTPWPTFRMTFRGFQKAFPDGMVFLGKAHNNPLFRIFGVYVETILLISTARQHTEAKPVLGKMSHSDDRLPNKTYVWGLEIEGDAVCFTDDFVIENDCLINSRIGNRDIVIAYDIRYESVGFWYNTTGYPVARIDFFGRSDKGQLRRVEKLKSCVFWHVWVEFFPNTDINRTGRKELQ